MTGAKPNGESDELPAGGEAEARAVLVLKAALAAADDDRRRDRRMRSMVGVARQAQARRKGKTGPGRRFGQTCVVGELLVVV